MGNPMPPEKLLQSGLTVRGDSVYCPLAFSLDSYWNCLTDLKIIGANNASTK